MSSSVTMLLGLGSSGALTNSPPANNHLFASSQGPGARVLTLARSQLRLGTKLPLLSPLELSGKGLVLLHSFSLSAQRAHLLSSCESVPSLSFWNPVISRTWTSPSRTNLRTKNIPFLKTSQLNSRTLCTVYQAPPAFQLPPHLPTPISLTN